MLAINTLGVLYIVESGDTVHSVEDLRGKTIYASGKGNTPEYALNYVLTQNGIDPASDVTIEWKSEQAECLSALMAEENTIAMLPQPSSPPLRQRAKISVWRGSDRGVGRDPGGERRPLPRWSPVWWLAARSFCSGAP